MKTLKDKVAVVTGGGNGIGAGLCESLAAEGMKIVVADIDLAAAEGVAALLCEGGAQARAVRTDVADRPSLEELAAFALGEMGGVHVLCNNAGVFVGGPLRKMTEGDWQWMLSVNLMGVVNGCQVFAPHLIAQGEGHIVNTASMGGMLIYAGMSVYCATKFAVVAFSEALRRDLEPHGVGVSILCPGKVRTRLAEADRLRPSEAGPAGGTSQTLAGRLDDGMDPLAVGGCLVRGIHANAEYIFTHPQVRGLCESRFQRILRAFDVAE